YWYASENCENNIGDDAIEANKGSITAGATTNGVADLFQKESIKVQNNNLINAAQITINNTNYGSINAGTYIVIPGFIVGDSYFVSCYDSTNGKTQTATITMNTC